MHSINRLLLISFAVVCFSSLLLPSVQASSNNSLIKVTVNIIIEDPDYFWQYPFEGKGADYIIVSGMGKKETIEKSSSGTVFEVDVPKGYQFRMYTDLYNESSLLKSVYYAKRKINETNRSFAITLKAPLPQQVDVHTSGFDETK